MTGVGFSDAARTFRIYKTDTLEVDRAPSKLNLRTNNNREYRYNHDNHNHHHRDYHHVTITTLLSPLQQERYRKMRTVASNFGIIQFGVTLFMRDTGGAGGFAPITARPFNCLVFPGAEGADFVISPGAIKFLAKCHLDFGQWFDKGVPFGEWFQLQSHGSSPEITAHQHTNTPTHQRTNAPIHDRHWIIEFGSPAGTIL
jgi:hypothetical protein